MYIISNNNFVQIIACGDFKQLPPVPNLLHNDPGLHCFKSNMFDLTFPHKLNLTEVGIEVLVMLSDLC